MKKRLVVMMTVFLAILLFTPSCGTASAEEFPPGLPPQPSKPHNTPQELLPSTHPNGAKPPPVFRRKPHALRAMALPADTCRSRHLVLDTPELKNAGEEARLWHICYTPPSSSVSTTSRAERFRLEIFTEHGPQTIWVSELDRHTTDVVTLSLLIILPAQATPAFQGWTIYDDSSSTGILDTSEEESFPTIQGELALWRVNQNGEQTPEFAHHGCRAPLPGMERYAFFLPTDQCPGLERTCPLLERLDCRLL